MKISEERIKGICCPFCDCRTIYAKVMTTMTFIGTHYVYTDGIDMEGDTMTDIVGEPACDPIMKVSKFHCASCGRTWIGSFLNIRVNDESGECSFIEMEEGAFERIKNTKDKDKNDW